MDKEELAKVLKALEAFDRSAQVYGWHTNEGSVTTEYRAKRLYKAAKSRLVNLLKDLQAAEQQK